MAPTYQSAFSPVPQYGSPAPSLPQPPAHLYQGTSTIQSIPDSILLYVLAKSSLDPYLLPDDFGPGIEPVSKDEAKEIIRHMYQTYEPHARTLLPFRPAFNWMTEYLINPPAALKKFESLLLVVFDEKVFRDGKIALGIPDYVEKPKKKKLNPDGTRCITPLNVPVDLSEDEDEE